MINNQQFLTEEESLKVQASLLTSEEKFLTRLTISSWRLLKLIAQHYNKPMEELTVEEIISWMERDSKIRREKGPEFSVLKW